jgi:arylsulfatase A-like enzyme
MDDWLPVQMQNAGYDTYYVGKLMNSYSEKNYNKPFVKGFNGSDFLCGGGTYNYYNPVYQRNRDPPKNYPNNYTVDLTYSKGMGFLDDARKSNRPFFLTMAPVAPHNGAGPRPPNTPKFGPVPAKKYANLFNNVKVPRTKNFNPNKVHEPAARRVLANQLSQVEPAGSLTSISSIVVRCSGTTNTTSSDCVLCSRWMSSSTTP